MVASGRDENKGVEVAIKGIMCGKLSRTAELKSTENQKLNQHICFCNTRY
jgi:hypothetical protein